MSINKIECQKCARDGADCSKCRGTGYHRADWDAELKMWRERLAGHEVVIQPCGQRAQLRRRKSKADGETYLSSDAWIDVVIVRGGALFHGDFDPVLVYGGSDTHTIEGVARWCATFAGSMSYGWEKIDRGMRGWWSGQPDLDLAKLDVIERMDEEIAELDDEDDDARKGSKARALARTKVLAADDLEGVYDAAHLAGFDPWEWRAGGIRPLGMIEQVIAASEVLHQHFVKRRGEVAP